MLLQDLIMLLLFSMLFLLFFLHNLMFMLPQYLFSIKLFYFLHFINSLIFLCFQLLPLSMPLLSLSLFPFFIYHQLPLKFFVILMKIVYLNNLIPHVSIYKNIYMNLNMINMISVWHILIFYINGNIIHMHVTPLNEHFPYVFIILLSPQVLPLIL